MAEMERVHVNAILPGPGHINNLPPPSTPPQMIEASRSPSAPPRPAAVRAVRCLWIGVTENTQEAEYTPPVDESAAATMVR